MNRLTTATGPAGNFSYSYGPAGRLASDGTTAYSYDTAGNQTTAGTASYGYDALGQLTTATIGAATTTYAYVGGVCGNVQTLSAGRR